MIEKGIETALGKSIMSLLPQIPLQIQLPVKVSPWPYYRHASPCQRYRAIVLFWFGFFSMGAPKILYHFMAKQAPIEQWAQTSKTFS